MARLGLALALVLAGAGAAELLRGSEARAAVAEGGRYQISSYGYALPNGEQRHGAFIIDTESGEIFQTAAGSGTQKVGRLPR